MLKSKRLLLRPLRLSDVTRRYLRWMNDEETQAYTRRRGTHTTLQELKRSLAQKPPEDRYFAIMVKKRHIGNLFLRRRGTAADLSIMIGDKSARGKGYAREAVIAAAEYAFGALELSALTAGSANPAFNALMRRLKWRRVRTKRGGFRMGARRIDVVYWRMVKKGYGN